MDATGTKKKIRIFAAASFLNDLGSDMIYPIWPMFVTTVLGANMAVLGLIDGLGETFVSISKAASGYISDRIKRRKVFIWTGYLFGSLSRVGYAFSTSWCYLIPLKILDRMGKIRGAPRDAIIADISSRENRGQNFGIVKTMDNLGAVCGVVICILFFKLLGYRNFFLLAAIPSTMAALLIFLFVKEKRTDGFKIYEGLSFSELDNNFKLFLLLSGVFALGSFSYSFLLIYAGEAGISLTSIPIFYLIFTASASVSSIPFGRLSDKIGRKTVLVFSFVLWGLTCLNLLFFRGYRAIILSFILYGLHKGGIETVQKTFAAELAPVKFRASGLGSFQMVIGLCALPSSLIAGILWDKVSMYTPFYFSLALTFISTMMLMFVKETALPD